MSSEKKDGLTETEKKILEGDYEINLKEWQRMYNFTYWKEEFKKTGETDKYPLFLNDLDIYFKKQLEDWAFVDEYEYKHLYPTEF
jgi:hypothetical protein